MIISLLTPFQEKIYKLVKNIPCGEVLTYKQVARAVGSPRAFRVVGNILNKNIDSEVPCHRVVRSDGKVGGYRYGQKRKIALLEKEGVLIKKRKIILCC